MTPDHSDKQTPRARAGDQPTIPSIVIELHIGRLPEAPAKVENCLRDDTIASFPSYEVSEDRRSLNGATEISTPFPNRPDSPFPHHAYKLFFPIARGVQALIGDSFKIRELAKFNILKPLTTNLELYVSLDPIDQKGEKSKLACDGSLITDDGRIFYFKGYTTSDRISRVAPDNNTDLRVIHGGTATEKLSDGTYSVEFRCPEEVRTVLESGSPGLYGASLIDIVNEAIQLLPRNHRDGLIPGPAFLIGIDSFSLPKQEAIGDIDALLIQRDDFPTPTKSGFYRSAFHVKFLNESGAILGQGTWQIAEASSEDHYWEYVLRRHRNR